MIKLRNILAITVCFLILISPMVVFAETNSTDLTITSEKKII